MLATSSVILSACFYIVERGGASPLIAPWVIISVKVEAGNCRQRTLPPTRRHSLCSVVSQPWLLLSSYPAQICNVWHTLLEGIADATDSDWSYDHPLTSMLAPFVVRNIGLELLLRGDLSPCLNSGPGLICCISSLLLPSAPLIFVATACSGGLVKVAR